MQGMVARDDDAPGSGETLKSRAGDRPENTFQRAAIVWKRLPMPVIGAIHGVAFGAGAQIALGADIRFMAPDVRFSILEIKWGLIPDVGISQTLREIVSLDVAKELTWTGRILDGPAARELGLATHVSERPLEDAPRARCRDRDEVAGRDPPWQAPARGDLAGGRPHGARARGPSAGTARRLAQPDRVRQGELREARPELRASDRLSRAMPRDTADTLASREALRAFLSLIEEVDRDFLSEERRVTEAADVAEGEHMLLHLVKAALDVWVDNDAARPRASRRWRARSSNGVAKVPTIPPTAPRSTRAAATASAGACRTRSTSASPSTQARRKATGTTA